MVEIAFTRYDRLYPHSILIPRAVCTRWLDSGHPRLDRAPYPSQRIRLDDAR